MARRRRRERIGTVVLTALIVGGISIPATAEPPAGSGITAVPDGGARPATFGEIPLLPSGTLAVPQTLPITPLAVLDAQRTAALAESQVLAERINELKIEHERCRLELAWSQHAWSLAEEKVKAAKEAAAAAASEAYRAARELPPQFQNGALIRDLDLLQPGVKTFSESTAYELERAVAAEKEAADRLKQATADEKLAQENLDFTIASFQQRDAARLLLDQRYKALQADEERQREREANKLSAAYDPGGARDGYRAAVAAQEAVRFALSQLGKPYRFAEEGPNYYDCSGLVQTAYKPNKLLPRVSWNMYQATKDKEIRRVNFDDLLPGDLIFFARDPGDPRTIHHVALYLGDGKVVHATSTGDVVKISKLNFGPGGPVDFATRVFDAVKVG
jgi:cell wall-associated NlpC family hydrolase